MTEDEFQAEVIKLIEKYSIKWHHCTDSRKCQGHGLPDLILVGFDYVAFVELKTDVGQLRGRQVSWRKGIEATHNGYYELWRPSDLRSGYIERILSQL